MVWNEALKREVPEGWEILPLGELFIVCSGKDHKHLATGPFPIIGSGGVIRQGSDFLYDRESVLIPRKGTLNNVMYMQTPFWTVDTMFYTKPKRENIMKYIFMAIRDFNFERLNTGTGVPSMTGAIINKITLPIPEKNILEVFDSFIMDVFQKKNMVKHEISVLTQLRDTLLPLLMNGQVMVK